MAAVQCDEAAREALAPQFGKVALVVFGAMAAIVGAYKGLNAGGGPSGVGRAVNESVIIAFMLLFFMNAVITAIYFQVVPQKGG